jgi:hypothetical protein
VEKSYAERYQTLKIATVDFSLDAFKKEAKVTDDEVKKYYEENKESYKTAAKRALGYVLFEEPKAENEKGEKLDAEKFAEAQKKFGERVRKFNDEVTKPGAKLDDVAKQLGEKVLTLDLFEQGTPPEAIKDESDLISSVFFNDPKLRPVADPVRGSKGIYIFSVTKDEQPRQQEQKEVESKVKDALIATKAEEAMMKAANDARTALQDGLKAGKKLADLVKEKKLTLSAETEYSPAGPNPPEMKLGTRVTEAATHLAAGQPSVPISTETGAAIVFVNARELRKRDDSAAQRSSMESSQQSQAQSDLFKAWFRARRDAAGVDYKLQLS